MAWKAGRKEDLVIPRCGSQSIINIIVGGTIFYAPEVLGALLPLKHVLSFNLVESLPPLKELDISFLFIGSLLATRLLFDAPSLYSADIR